MPGPLRNYNLEDHRLADLMIEIACDTLKGVFDGQKEVTGTPSGTSGEGPTLVLTRRQAERVLVKAFLKKTLRGASGYERERAGTRGGGDIRGGQQNWQQAQARLVAERAIRTFMRLRPLQQTAATWQQPGLPFDSVKAGDRQFVAKLLAKRAVNNLCRGPFRVRQGIPIYDGMLDTAAAVGLGDSPGVGLDALTLA